MEFEDILSKVGSFGRHQKLMIIAFVAPVSMLMAILYTSNLFFLSVPEHWCRVPELEALNLTSKQERDLSELGIRTSCSVLELNYSDLISPSGDLRYPENATSTKCDEWNYDKTHYEFTAATQWNMVCDHDHYASFALTMVHVGITIGTPIGGYVSDRFGRRPSFFLLTFVTSVTLATSVLVTNFTAFVLMRMFSVFFLESIYHLSWVIVVEVVGVDVRTRMNGFFGIFWTIGTCMTSLMAWLTRDWIKLCLITAIFIALLITHYPFLYESPQWLISRKRYDEAAKILYKISKKNGKAVFLPEITNQIRELGHRTELKKKSEENTESPFILLKSSKLRKVFFTISLCWIANLSTYYGLLINGQNLAGDEFLNIFLLALAEAPGYLSSWIFMQKIGRRWCSVFYLALAGLACLVPVIYSEGAIWASFIGRLGSSGSFMSMYQQSSELFPTGIRVFGLGLSATLASIATFAVPYIAYLHNYGGYIPFLIFSLMSLCAAFVASFLPETLHMNLPQTVADIPTLGIDQKYFSLNRKKQLAAIEMDSSVKDRT